MINNANSSSTIIKSKYWFNKQCHVPDCSNCSTMGSGVTKFYFPFPAESQARSRWLNALSVENGANISVCEDHFNTEDIFLDKTKRKKLLPNSTPTLNLLYPTSKPISNESANLQDSSLLKNKETCTPAKNYSKKRKRVSWSTSEKYHLFWTIKKYGNVKIVSDRLKINWDKVIENYRENGGVGNERELKSLWQNLKTKAYKVGRSERYGTYLERKIAKYIFKNKLKEKNNTAALRILDEGTEDDSTKSPKNLGVCPANNTEDTNGSGVQKQTGNGAIERFIIRRENRPQTIDSAWNNNHSTSARICDKNSSGTCQYQLQYSMSANWNLNNLCSNNQRIIIDATENNINITNENSQTFNHYKQTDSILLNNAKTYVDASTDTSIDNQLYLNQSNNRTIGNNHVPNVAITNNDITKDNQDNLTIENYNSMENVTLKRVEVIKVDEEQDDTSDDEYYSIRDIEEKLGIKLKTITSSDSEMD